MEKPLSKEHAFEMLKSLSNAEHVVYTSVSLVFSKKKDPSTSKIPWIYSFTEGTRVTFCELPAQVIQDYIDSGTPM